MTAARAARQGGIHPIYLVGSNSTGSGSGSATIAQPSGVKAGDVGILTVNTSGTFNTPSGWSISNGNYYKVYGASEGSVTYSSSSTKLSITLAVFRNVNNANPIDIGGGHSTGSGSTTAAAAALTASYNDVLVNCLQTQCSANITSMTINTGTIINSNAWFTIGTAIAWLPRVHAASVQAAATWTLSSTISGAASANCLLLRAA